MRCEEQMGTIEGGCDEIIYSVREMRDHGRTESSLTDY